MPDGNEPHSLEGLVALAVDVLAAARTRDRTIATAESCTGGLVAHLLTQVPGASVSYLGGWVLYANRLKSTELAVPATLIEREGAVSEAVVLALARGARERAGADVAVATTGIAGPTGGSAEKPMGLLWCAVADEAGAAAHRLHVPPQPRDGMKRIFAYEALQILHARLGAH